MELPLEPEPRRIRHFVMAGLIVMVAVTVGWIGIRLMIYWLNLSPRIAVLNLTFGAFLLVLGAAVPSRGRIRVILFYLLMLSLPLVFLAAIEAASVSRYRVCRFAPFVDVSIFVN